MEQRNTSLMMHAMRARSFVSTHPGVTIIFSDDGLGLYDARNGRGRLIGCSTDLGVLLDQLEGTDRPGTPLPRRVPRGRTAPEVHHEDRPPRRPGASSAGPDGLNPWFARSATETRRSA